MRAAWLDVGRRAVSRQPAHGSGDDVGGVPRRVPLQPHAGGEHDLGRSQGNDWLAGGGRSSRCGATGAGCCPCLATAATNGTAISPSARCRTEANPARGFIATANNYLFPNAGPNQDAMHYDWADPYRAARITELLGSGRLFSVAEMSRASRTTTCRSRRARWCRCFATCHSRAAPPRKARELLQGWDFVLDKNSVAAGIYEMWQRRLFANTRMRLTPPALREIGGTFLTTKRLIDSCTRRTAASASSPHSARDALARPQPGRSRRRAQQTLRTGSGELAVRAGPVPLRADRASAERRRQRQPRARG